MSFCRELRGTLKKPAEKGFRGGLKNLDYPAVESEVLDLVSIDLPVAAVSTCTVSIKMLLVSIQHCYLSMLM